MNYHFLDLNNYDVADLERIIENSIQLKAKKKVSNVLEGKFLGLIFEKSSTRTRVSFEVAMTQLGGKASFLSVNDLQLGRGEPIEDTAIVLSSMVDGLVLRTLDHETQIKFSENSTVPVINGLSNKSHPCQLLADLLTFYEEKGSIKGRKVTWCGDFNNVCFSYAQAAELFDFDLWVACPEEYLPKEQLNFKNVTFTQSISEAVKNSDLISTDVWVSMGDENESQERIRVFKDYQVNESVLDQAKSEALFLHCLPAVKGQEISPTLLDDPRSKVWKQAENRLHAQKGLLLELLG
jgi:ornithine carbamoyltransferase